jgi:RNA polymerase sigma-70 factor (ECF subfamily)
MLYDRHAPTVYRFLTGFGIPVAEREDACQEVFLAIYRSLPRFRGEAQLSTWIYRIAGRTAAKLDQRRKLRGVLSALLLREPVQPLAADPSEQAARSVLLERLLQRLHPKKRMVVVLFEIEGLPIDEIARVANCPPNTVWSRLHHGRLELAKMATKLAAKTVAKSARPKPGARGPAMLRGMSAAPEAEILEGRQEGREDRP